MLNPLRSWRHLAVVGSLIVAPGLVLIGALGGGVYDERFEGKQIVVSSLEADGVRITEVVDDDFGNAKRHGYERLIPNDYGVPQDVEAFSPDAADNLSVVNEGSRTRIRIGDPDKTYSGQHRYVLSYSLLNAHITTGRLALDITDDQTELDTGRMEIVVTGFELANPVCSVGAIGAVGGCTLERDGDVYRAVIEPLAAHQGVTIGADIVRVIAPAVVTPPPIPERRDVNRPLWALLVALVGVGAAVGGYLIARRVGRNEVGGDSAADAAFGDGTSARNGAVFSGPTRLVSDAQLGDLATTEFEPPRGMRPWQGTLLLSERVSRDSVSAWFSDLIAQEALMITGDSPQYLSVGPKLADAPADVQKRIATLFSSADQIELGKYQSKLATLWKQIHKQQVRAADDSNWWKKFPPGSRARFPIVVGVLIVAAVAAVLIAAFVNAVLFWLYAWPVAIIAGFAVPAVVATNLYRPLLPVRSAVGSALALRTESFRRFLHASEGRHVDWAWKHGLVREYSAWAVALGEADAWGRAVGDSTVAPQDLSMHTMPMIVHTHRGDWTQASTNRSSSGFSGGGFSGGGSVGGGGGGGSSGNW